MPWSADRRRAVTKRFDGATLIKCLDVALGTAHAAGVEPKYVFLKLMPCLDFPIQLLFQLRKHAPTLDGDVR